MFKTPNVIDGSVGGGDSDEDSSAEEPRNDWSKLSLFHVYAVCQACKHWELACWL